MGLSLQSDGNSCSHFFFFFKLRLPKTPKPFSLFFTPDYCEEALGISKHANHSTAILTGALTQSQKAHFE